MISSHQGTNWKYCMPPLATFFVSESPMCRVYTLFGQRRQKAVTTVLCTWQAAEILLLCIQLHISKDLEIQPKMPYKKTMGEIRTLTVWPELFFVFQSKKTNGLFFSTIQSLQIVSKLGPWFSPSPTSNAPHTAVQPVAAARVPGVSPALSTKSWSKKSHSKKQQKGKPKLHDVHKINENGSKIFCFYNSWCFQALKYQSLIKSVVANPMSVTLTKRFVVCKRSRIMSVVNLSRRSHVAAPSLFSPVLLLSFLIFFFTMWKMMGKNHFWVACLTE